MRLEIAYRTRSLVLRQIQPVQHLTLEIIDYPGEWLLDLPLLEQGFAQFSADAIGLAEQPVRRPAAGAGYLVRAGRGIRLVLPSTASTRLSPVSLRKNGLVKP